jgi:hypothetical protein
MLKSSIGGGVAAQTRYRQPIVAAMSVFMAPLFPPPAPPG